MLYIVCASVQPVAGAVRTGLHCTRLRHENNKKQAGHNTLLVFVVELRGVEPLSEKL